jgi:membrane-bound serine protease (ClpP class)
MKILLLGFLFFSFVLKANDTLVPVVEIPDSINPGTADYLISQIENAERQKSPLLLLRMDTPGGLLSSTREIIQRMLNSPVLIVVFIGPQGAPQECPSEAKVRELSVVLHFQFE